MKDSKMWLGLLVAGGLLAVAAGSADAEPVRRESVVQGGVAWSYSIIGETATVTGAEPAEGKLEIPSSLGGHAVGAVGYAAFAGCEELTAVVVPAGVGSIGERAFQYCTALEEVSLPAGLEAVGPMAFQYCESLAAVELPQSVREIGTNAFFHCGGLGKLYAPMPWWNTSNAATAGVGPGGGCTVVYGEPGKATLVFDPNGGACATVGRGYTPGEPYGWLPEATMEKHSFAGWWTATTGGTRVWATDTAAASESWRPLYARWAPLTQSVTFDPNGGTCDTTNRVYAAGDPYSPLPVAVRKHYDFAGWWTTSYDSYGSERITEETLVTTNAMRTLYARWALAQQAVTFDAQGGSCATTAAVYAVDGTYKPLPKATREGYAFDGWFTAAAGGDRLSSASPVTAAEYRTLYAHWTLTEQVVTFLPNGGSCATESRAYTVGSNYGWLPEASREGIAFAGWFDLVTGVRVETSDEMTVARQRWLYARWGTVAEAAKVAAYAPDPEAGSCTVRFKGRAGVTYDLQRRQKMESGSWTTVATKVADTDGDITMVAEMPAGWASAFHRVVAEGEGGDDGGLYLVVDMSGGRNAERWPVKYLGGIPEGGWTDEYKTTQLVLRVLPPGTFTMGSPSGELGREDNEVQHTVTLTKPFWMGVFEVTQRQWELATGNRPSYFDNSNYYAARPVERVSYNDIRGSSAGAGWPDAGEVDASSFLGILRAKTGLAFDLPTEAQWEYACRAGTTTALNSGKNLTGTDSCPNMAAVGRYWYNGGEGYSSSCSTTYGTAKVGSYQPNAWGLYDMHGNVWEWCLDWWYGSYDAGDAVNPVGEASGSYRVQRGGSWSHDAQDCRSAYRDDYFPSSGYASSGGFRLCCSAGLP